MSTNLKKIEQHYLDYRQKIISSLSKQEDIDLAGDEVDKIQADALGSMIQKLSARDLYRLSQIDTALQAIRDGVLDECQECSESIGDKRLLAIPGVRICISCAEEAENNAKMFA